MRRIGFNTRAFFSLAAPMIVSRAGLAAMGIADGVMVARFEAREFAWLSLAEGTLGRLLDVFVALLIGALSLAPRQFAQNDAAGARLLWRRTLPVAVGLGLVGSVVGIFGSTWLSWLGQAPELSRQAGSVMAILGAGYPAALLAISAGVYLEGVGRPKFVAVCVVSANVLNIALNWVLIGGHLGFPALGARGSAWSTTAVRVALMLALAGHAWLTGTGSSLESVDRAASLRSQWRLALGSAGTVAALVLLTAWLTVFAGWLGVLPLAAFAAAWNVAAPAGLIALGLSDAAGIQVASAAGRYGEREAATVAWSCLHVTLATVAVLAAILAAGSGTLAKLYSHDLGLRQSMASVLPLVACVLLADAASFVMVASLRALREAAWPAAIEIGSMLILVPLAAVLALQLGYGVRGLFLAAIGAGSLRALFLIARFAARTSGAVLLPPRQPVTDDWILK